MFPTAKRTACDRCRGQKLRCPPRGNPTQPCERCTRARKECVTGFTKRLGRASWNAVQTMRSDGYARQTASPDPGGSTAENTSLYSCEPQRTQLPGTPTSSLLNPTPSFVNPSSSSGSTLPSDWTYCVTNADTILTQHGWGSTDASAGAGAGYVGSLLEGSASIPDHSVAHGLGNIGLDLWSPTTPAPSGITDATDNDPSASTSPLRTCDHRNPPEVSDTSNPSQAPNVENSPQRLVPAECDRQLLELSSDACKQISNQDKLLLFCRESNTRSAGTMQQIHDAIGNALSSNARFITILQAYRGEGSRQGDSEREVASLTLQLTCSLNAVTTYLRLIVLFDKLLLSLYHVLLSDEQTLTTSDSGALHEAQLLPGLQLAGFPISQSGFQAKILVQAISHQFETMESMLAVPLEMRVSDKKSAYTGGFLWQGLDEQLLKSLLSTQFSMTAPGSRSAPPAQRIAPLASLRNSIEKVQELSRIT